MKIKHVSIRNNPILWNINLDFVKNDWTISDTILFVGENWSWKSTLLNIIYAFCNLDDPKLYENESRSFVIDMNHWEFWNWEYSFLFDKNFHNWLYNQGSRLSNVSISKNSQDIPVPTFMVSETTKKVLKWVFTDVSINFNTKEIKSITNLDTDVMVESSIRSWSDTAQNIKQLFVDIINKDWLDLQNWVDDNDGVVPPEEVKHVRLNRFKRAFNYMFNDEWLEFSGSDSSTLTPIFRKNWWKNILIDNLSSWEKQIAYRWWFLLKDRNSLSDSVILIDEPEISMHPLRQDKILNFYKNLFKIGEESIISQIFVTTHSPYILCSMNYEDDKVFTFPWWTEVINMRKYLWEKPSLALLNYKIFNITTTDLFIELYWYIQESLNLWSLNSMDEKFKEWWYRQDYIWKKYNSETDWPEDIYYTIFTYIRNCIHHPENPYENRNFTKQELKESIENMINLIETYNIELETNLDNQND